MNSLYLTKAEQSLFLALPETVKEGWKVEAENLSFTDSIEHRRMRMRFMRLHDQRWQDLIEKAKTASDEKALATLILKTGIKGIDDGDLSALFFVLGPGPLSTVIADSLSSASSDSELEDVSALTTIRHSLLASLQPKK